MAQAVQSDDSVVGVRTLAVRSAWIVLPLCFIAYCFLDRFPILYGAAMCAASALGVFVAVKTRTPLWSPVLVQLLFMLMYPVCCAHVTALHEIIWWLNFSHEEHELAGVIRLALLGQLGIVAATVVVGHLFPPPEAARPSSLLISPTLLLTLGACLVVTSGVVSFATGVGVIGYAAAPTVPFVSGFIVRMSTTTVPMFNLTCLTHAARQGQKRELLIALSVSVAEGLLLAFTTLSRLVLLFFVLAPLLFLLTVPDARRLVSRVRLMVSLIAATLLGLAATNAARDATYASLSRGSGYSREAAVSVASDSDDDWVTSTLSSTDIYRRLMGFPDLTWVWASHYSGTMEDFKYAVVEPPPDNPSILNERIGISDVMNVSTNAEMSFGGGVGLIAVMAIPGPWYIVPGVALSMGLLFAAELLLRRLVSFGPQLAATIFLMINLWQGLPPIGMLIGRIGQVAVISVILIVLLERPRRRAPSISVSTA